MKHTFVRWLAVLTVLCLSMVVVPVAMMEDLFEAPDNAVANKIVFSQEPVTQADNESDHNDGLLVEFVDEIVDEEDVDWTDEPEDEYLGDWEVINLDSYEAMVTTPEYNGLGVNITEAEFPDEAFREYVKSTFDLDHDGVLSDEERAAVTDIALTEYSEDGKRTVKVAAKSLAGIQYFTELKDLSCECLGLTALDLSGNTKLMSMDCSENQLTTLNLSNNLELESLYCYSNKLTALEVINNTKLVNLFCFDNQLTALNVSNNPNLERLECDDNQLTALNVTNNTALQGLSISRNRITAIDVSNNTRLEYLYCFSNLLTSLDISKNTTLKELGCSNNALTTLNVSNNGNLEYLACESNKITELDIKNLTKIIPYITDQYKREENNDSVYYVQTVETIGGETAWSGIQISFDKATKVITEEPKYPTISVIRKNLKTTIHTVPGTVYEIDLNGQEGSGFKSSKKKVATVNRYGFITVKGAGTTKITFKVNKKKRTLTLKVVDSTIPTYVKLNMSGNVIVEAGDTVTLEPTLPEGSHSGIKWKSSRKSVATVNSNGVVTFKKKGKVTITATTTRGKKKAWVRFKVTD